MTKQLFLLTLIVLVFMQMTESIESSHPIVEKLRLLKESHGLTKRQLGLFDWLFGSQNPSASSTKPTSKGDQVEIPPLTSQSFNNGKQDESSKKGNHPENVRTSKKSSLNQDDSSKAEVPVEKEKETPEQEKAAAKHELRDEEMKTKNSGKAADNHELQDNERKTKNSNKIKNEDRVIVAVPTKPKSRCRRIRSR